MPPAGSVYYHSLRPFRALFEQGLPILTYHKLGPRPRNTRLKGLYLSQRLFARQLAELRRAGFESVSLTSIQAGASTPNRSVVLTFDDGFVNVLQFGSKPLADYGCQAIQFL